MALDIKRSAAMLATIVVAMFAIRMIADAAAGTAADPDDATGVDIEEVFWSDTATAVTLGFRSYESPLSDGDSKSEWLFDLNNDGVPAEACALIKSFGGNLTTEFYASGTCGPEVQTSVAASHPAADEVQFSLQLQDLRDAGLAASATQYRFRVKNSVTNDKVPDLDTNLLTHSLGASGSASPSPSSSASASPSPSPGASASPSPSASPSASPCPSPTASPTTSPSPSASASASASPSASPTATPSGSSCHTSATGVPSKSTAAPGDSLEIAGDGFKGGAKLEIEFRSEPKSLGTTTAAGSGTFATAVRIPSDATAGAHQIVVAGANTRGGTHTVRFPITVTTGSGGTSGAASSGSGSGSAAGSGETAVSAGGGATLPKTGLGLASLVLGGLLLVLGGVTVADESSMWRRRLRR